MDRREFLRTFAQASLATGALVLIPEAVPVSKAVTVNFTNGARRIVLQTERTWGVAHAQYYSQYQLQQAYWQQQANYYQAAQAQAYYAQQYNYWQQQYYWYSQTHVSAFDSLLRRYSSWSVAEPSFFSPIRSAFTMAQDYVNQTVALLGANHDGNSVEVTSSAGVLGMSRTAEMRRDYESSVLPQSDDRRSSISLNNQGDSVDAVRVSTTDGVFKSSTQVVRDENGDTGLVALVDDGSRESLYFHALA